MAIELTTRARLLSQQTRVEPQIILKIKGIDFIFGAVEVTSAVKYGSSGVSFGDAGVYYGGVVEDPNSRDWISLDGTTTNITQQLLQDQGGTSSISNFNIVLVNKRNDLAETFIPSINIPDILAADAEVFLTFQGSSYPEDAVKIFSGIVGSAAYGAGNIRINISHPEELKRQEVFTKIDTELSAAVDSVQTNIPVVSTTGVFATQDDITSYIRVEDEIMEITAINSNSFDVVRGSLGTTAAAHADETEAGTFYVFTTKPIQGALKLMLSGGDEFYEVLDIENINSPEGSFVQNALTFNSLNLNSDYGIVAGDSVTISGSGFGANNVTRTILSVESLDSVSYIVVDGDPLINEGNVGATCSFKSKYNVLSDGLGMRPFHVDILEHERLESIFSTSFPDYVFYLKESVDAKEFIDKELYFPSNLFSIPRKGRASVGFVSPPLSSDLTPAIDDRNITNVGSLKVERSIKKDFYNAIVYKFNEQLLEDNFLAGEILQSSDSTARIKIKNRPLVIESKGLRRDGATILKIQRLQDRLIERYKFAAKRVNSVEVLYKDGFNLEAGDVVTFARPETKLIDPDTGEYLESKLFEVVNKSLNVKTGSIRLDLLDTNFSIDAKFGVIAPSSIIDSGSTTTVLRLQKSFGTQAFQEENAKWGQFVGLKVIVHNETYSVFEEATILRLSPTIPDAIELSSPLGFTPSSGYYVDLADYDDSSLDAELYSKNNHCYINPTAQVSSGASNTVFDVSDASDLLVGQTIKVRNTDFTNESDETTITDITGLTITVADDLGFTPSNGDFVELIGFLDTGKPYRII